MAGRLRVLTGLVLYDYEFSGNGWKVRTLLRHLGRPFRIRWVDILAGEQNQPWFRALNPIGQIPVLKSSDGLAWTESTAILQTFAEGTSLLPAGHAGHQVRAWMCFEQTWVDGVISRARFRRAFPHVVPTSEDFFAVWEADGRRALTTLEQHLRARRFLVDERFTIADIALFSYVHLSDEAGLALSDYPAIRRWIHSVASERGVRALSDNPEVLEDSARALRVPSEADLGADGCRSPLESAGDGDSPGTGR